MRQSADLCFALLFIPYLLHTHHVPGAVLGARDTIVMTDMALVFIGFTSPEVLSLATLDILDSMILCCGMLSRILASIH